MPISQKVIIAMSGGVDSAVAAFLLQQSGFEVEGLTLRLWHYREEEQGGLLAAQEVSAKLGLPLHILDARNDFKQEVVQAFINDQLDCQTPNPCIFCNRVIKWRKLLDFADQNGVEYVSTGHYARVVPGNNNKFELWKALDHSKDQSYMLSRLTQTELSRTLFPLGGHLKTEVRQIARELGLSVAERAESQDLCFVNHQDYPEFLREALGNQNLPGEIRTRQGNLLGHHQGLAFYTIGQRKGLPAHTEALYVLEKEPNSNTLIVGPASELGQTVFYIRDMNWISGEAPALPLQTMVKIRYRAQPTLATIHPQKDQAYQIRLEHPLRDITPGQAAVFYEADKVLGGGTIATLQQASFHS